MVPHSERLSERWRCLSTLPTDAYFAERTMSSEHVLESGNANLAAKPLLEEPTHCPQPVVSQSVVPSAVFEECNKKRHKWVDVRRIFF